MKRDLWQPAVRTTFRVFLRLLRVVPWNAALAGGEALGALAYRLSARYRGVADKNLRIAYGDSLTERQRQTLIRRVFQNFARATLIEFLKAPDMSPDRVRALVRADSFAPAEAALARGKGLIVVTAHLGNWELLARRAALEGYRFAVVARPSHDPAFNELTDRLRETGGYTVHPRGASPRPILQRLRRNGILAILPDQKSEDIVVPFFGRPAGTVAGPAVLSLKTGAAILPIFCPRQPDGTYRMEILPEIDTAPTGDMDADVRRIMTDINRAIEGMIRRYPDQWLWLHDRWRVPPPPAPNPSLALTPRPPRPREGEGGAERRVRGAMGEGNSAGEGSQLG